MPDPAPSTQGIEIKKLHDHAAPKKAVDIVQKEELRCPFGLERTPQGIEVILRNLDVPRGTVAIHLYLGVLAAQLHGKLLASHVKILPMVKEAFGEKYGHQEPFSVYFEKRKGLKEDGRTKLSCTGNCISCEAVDSEKIRLDIQNIKKTMTT